MALRNAFADLVTEPIAQRLNQLVNILAPFGLALDRATGGIRVFISGAVASVTAVGTVTTVTTVTTTTTVGTVTNQANLGGLPANTLVLDSMAMRWATSVRDRIT